MSKIYYRDGRIGMTNTKNTIAVGLAAATLAVCIVNAVGNIAILTKAGPTPILSMVSIATAAAAFAISWKMRSYVISGLLAVSGIVFMVPALNAMGYSLATIKFPGPILGVIFGLGIFGLGVIKGIKLIKTVEATVSH
jgi:hypothetical protein